MTSSCYRAYSLLFVPFALVVFLGLLVSGREFIWNIDGLSQYYPFFVYEGEWLRGIIGDLVSGKGLNVPMWAWQSGYGSDVITTFDVFFDPLNLFSVIAPGRASELMFQFLVLVRLYLAGIAFVFYCRVRQENRRGTVLGALLYTFCGAGLVVVQWTSGLHAFILFPVVLAGAEKLLAGGKPWVFIASLTLLAIVSYYFTYMVCILLVMYLALRVIMVFRDRLTVGFFLKWTLAFASLVVLCMAIAAFSLVPAITALFGMDRVTEQSTVMEILYSPAYYIGLLSSFLSVVEVGSDTTQGFGGLAFFACLTLFSRKGENRELKIVFVVLTVFLLIPAIGSLFNGMNYATNRWAWAYAMCVAFILTRMTPHLLDLNGRTRRILIIGAAVYAVLLLIPATRTEANVAGYAALLATLLILVIPMNGEFLKRMLTCALALTLGVSGYYCLAADEGGAANWQSAFGVAYPKLTNESVDSLPLDAHDDSWWRYDASQVSIATRSPMNRIRNNSLVLGVNGIDFYNSIYNNGIDRFHTELAIAGDNINFNYLNLQGRSDLMALLGVKYYAMRTDGTDAAPALFNGGEVISERPVAGTGYQLLEANTYLPLGYVFDQAISHEDYLTLTPEQRQQALLQAVVVDDANTDGAGATLVSADELSFESENVPFSIVSSNGVMVEDGSFIAQAPGATVTLSVEGTANAETYLYTSGLVFRNLKPSELIPEETKAGMTWYRKAKMIVDDFNATEVHEYEIGIKSDVSPLSGYILNNTPDSHMYGGKDTWLVNLGYAEDAAHSITITFSQAGEYTYNDLQVITQTQENLLSSVEELSATPLENMQQGCNLLTGTLDMDTPGTLLLTVANSPGWSAYVDGEAAEIVTADSGFMGLELDAGHHDIELRYFTPGLALGGAVSAAGLIVLLVLALVLRLRGKSDRIQQDTKAS